MVEMPTSSSASSRAASSTRPPSPRRAHDFALSARRRRASRRTTTRSRSEPTPLIRAGYPARCSRPSGSAPKPTPRCGQEAASNGGDAAAVFGRRSAPCARRTAARRRRLTTVPHASRRPVKQLHDAPLVLGDLPMAVFGARGRLRQPRRGGDGGSAPSPCAPGCCARDRGEHVRAMTVNVSDPRERGTAFAWFNLTDDLGEGLRAGVDRGADRAGWEGRRRRARSSGSGCRAARCGRALRALTVRRGQPRVRRERGAPRPAKRRVAKQRAASERGGTRGRVRALRPRALATQIRVCVDSLVVLRRSCRLASRAFRLVRPPLGRCHKTLKLYEGKNLRYGNSSSKAVVRFVSARDVRLARRLSAFCPVEVRSREPHLKIYADSCGARARRAERFFFEVSRSGRCEPRGQGGERSGRRAPTMGPPKAWLSWPPRPR